VSASEEINISDFSFNEDAPSLTASPEKEGQEKVEPYRPPTMEEIKEEIDNQIQENLEQLKAEFVL